MTESAKQHIIRLLRGPISTRIRFTFPAGGGNLTLSLPHFHRVARAIDCGQIAVAVTNDLPADAGVVYDPDPGGRLDGRISIRPQYFGRVAEADVMHECTHAVFDLERTAITALDDKAAAYVVGGLYSRMSGLPQSRYDSPIRAVARAVETNLLSSYQQGNAPVPAVDLATWHLVRAIIPVRPAYVGGPAGTGGSYTHNG
jgi:hypothetical protein